MIPFLVLLLLGHHAVTQATLTAPRVPVSWPIRHHPRLLHLSPYLRGDSLGAVRLAGRLRRRGLVWGIDQNGNRSADHTVWIVHWRRYRLQFPFYVVRVNRRGREVRRPVPASWPKFFDDLTDAQAASLRSSLVGRRRPLRARRHMAEAAASDVPWCLEGKGRFRSAQLWARLRADAIDTRVVMVFMTLDIWESWQDDIRQAAAHGFPVAVLPRRPKPDNWAEFQRETGCQVWGRWR